MRIRSTQFATILSLIAISGASTAWANPIPGIPIIIRCPCPGPVYVESGRCCTKRHVSAARGALGPDSAPVDEAVLLQGPCAYACGPGSPGDGRIDYDTSSDAGPFAMSLPSMTLFSSTPLQVEVDGVLTPFDVVVTLSGQAPQADDPLAGMLTLAAGSSLPPGATAQVAGSQLDLHATTTFVNALTGEPSSAVIEEDLHLDLFTFTPAALPVARLADGTAEGNIVLGLGGDGLPVVFGYASANNELVLNLESLYDAGTVSATPATWGALKASYR